MLLSTDVGPGLCFQVKLDPVSHEPNVLRHRQGPADLVVVILGDDLTLNGSAMTSWTKPMLRWI
jgi:hypothetical protein